MSQFDRTIALINEDNFNKLQNANILLVGIGGVGGSVLEALVRSGFKNITIVDSEKIEETNLNRQIYTNMKNIGENKIKEAINYCNNIAETNLIGIDLFVNKDSIFSLNIKNFNIIVDCIDYVEGKIALYKEALKYGKIIISSCGTARKLDPTQIIYTQLDKTKNDRLAKKLREECKKENIDASKIDVITSLEQATESGTKPLPSMMMVPTAAAMAIVYKIVDKLIK